MNLAKAEQWSQTSRFIELGSPVPELGQKSLE